MALLRLFDTPQEQNEPTPIWLRRRQKLQTLTETAIKKGWRLSKFVAETLKLGVAPIINYKPLIDSDIIRQIKQQSNGPTEQI